MISAVQSIRLAIVSSHPIQYNAPLFKLLSQLSKLEVKVFYSWEGTNNQKDPEFEEKISWDIPLLDDYDYCFVENQSKDPGTHHFFGLDNPTMNQKIHDWGANTVLVYGWSFKTNLSVIRHFHGKIPVFFRGDSTLLTGGNALRQVLRKILLKWVYRYVDYALYPGLRSKAYFLAHGLAPEQLLYVPHSIDNKRFSDNSDHFESEALKLRQKMGIPEKAIVLIFVGKYVPRKQPLLLLKAVQELNASIECDEIHLVFVGSGPLKLLLIEKSQSDAYVHILGFKNQSEMPMIYRLGDIYVLPSNIETWGLGVNEAMACSRPVLVSNKVGCCVDLVKANVSGKVFEADNLESLKATIIDYTKDKERLLIMRDSASYLIDAWSLEKSAERMGSYIIEKVEKSGL